MTLPFDKIGAEEFWHFPTGQLILPSTGSLSSIVGDQTLTGAATNVDFTGLDGNDALGYRLFISVLNSSGLGIDMLVYVNADYTNANYYSERIKGTGAAPSSAITNYPTIGFFNNNIQATFAVDIPPPALSRVRFLSSMLTADASGYQERCGVLYTQAAANITGLRIASSQANGLGIGTRITLLKNNW